jgi:hypothetical protein
MCLSRELIEDDFHLGSDNHSKPQLQCKVVEEGVPVMYVIHRKSKRKPPEGTIHARLRFRRAEVLKDGHSGNCMKVIAVMIYKRLD